MVPPVEILGVVAYYDHYWSEKWSTTVGWSMTDLDTEDGQEFDEFKKGQIATANTSCTIRLRMFTRGVEE
jgi:hypothetical protein